MTYKCRHSTLMKQPSLIVLSLLVYLCCGDILAAQTIQYSQQQDQTMPKLCQLEPTICEGSFCIKKVEKCVCDLRSPVQIDRFCLRQVDIYGDCFASSQCNHTIKEAVCIDYTSKAVLDMNSGLFKLNQWYHLNEHKLSQPKPSSSAPQSRETRSSDKVDYSIEFANYSTSLRAVSQDQRKLAPMLAIRTSPYEINYDTEKLLAQNHTRRQNSSKSRDFNFTSIDTTTPTQEPAIKSSSTPVLDDFTIPNIYPNRPELTVTTQPTASVATSSIDDARESNGRRVIVITARWPPGTCYCPRGLMFDSMLRRCVAISLVESHCLIDFDCRQILSSHCSRETRKCVCDEPFVWNQTEMACVHPPPAEKVDNLQPIQDPVDIFSPVLLSKLLDARIGYITIIMMLLAIIVILGILLLLKLTVRCFSHKSSALISPKKKQQISNNVPPKSPYATLKRPDHKPASQLSDFTEATRGRILNYDFEQDNSLSKNIGDSNSNGFLGTLKSNKDAKVSSTKSEEMKKSSSNQKLYHTHKLKPDISDSPIELNDNISISQLESESKSDNSALAIPAPPPTQQPSYMMASVMRGQSSTIAAAAAAVANRRIQMAQAKNSLQQANNKVSDGHPVFL